MHVLSVEGGVTRVTAAGCQITMSSAANRTLLFDEVIEEVAEEERVLCPSLCSRWANVAICVDDVSKINISLLANRTLFLEDVEVFDALDTWSKRAELDFSILSIARSAMMSLYTWFQAA